MKYRLRKVARVVLAAAIAVIVAGAAAAVAVYLTGPSGLISCVPAAAPAKLDPIPRWVIAAGIPAVVALFIGAYFALAPERAFFRLIGLILTAVLVAGTFYAVYTLLPAACRP